MAKVPLLLSGDRPLPYVYRLTHRETGRFYIGYRSRNVILGRHHSRDLGVRYFTSCREIKKENFAEYNAVVIEESETAAQAFEREQALIEENWGNPLLINQFKQKVVHAEAKFQYRHSENTKRRIAAANTGKERTKEHCRNISKAKRGIQAKNKGKTWTQQQREKMEGRTYSSQAIANFSTGQKRRFEGSEEGKRLNHLGSEGRSRTRSRVEVVLPSGDVRRYDSVELFAASVGIKRRIAYHLVSGNDGRIVESGRLKGYGLRLIKFASEA